MKTVNTLFFVAITAISVNAIAHGDHEHGPGMMNDKMMEQDASESKAYSTTGVVQSINKETGMVMIKHEPVKELNWPSMSMGFMVNDDDQKSQLQEGDKIEFKFVQKGSNYVITAIKK